MNLIPEEILLAIIAEIPHCRDLNSLSRTSKKFYLLTLPFLYSSVTIKAENEFNLAETDASQFYQASQRRLLTHAKDLIFWAPIEEKRKFRCIHFNQDREYDDVAESYGDLSETNDMGQLMPEIRPLFLHLKDNQLTRFSWHLGTCLPQALLGPAGILPTTQTSLTHLSLNTGDPCIVPKDDISYPIHLTAFTSLTSFSWIGGLSREFFDALHDMFLVSQITNNLECLKLDFCDWWDTQWNWCGYQGEWNEWIREHNFFALKVLGLSHEGEPRILFPKLKRLALSALHVEGWEKEIVTAFNFSNLHSLTLKDCFYSGSLFRAVMESGQAVQLRELEIVIYHEEPATEPLKEAKKYIQPFLESFEGLESLRLLVSNERKRKEVMMYWSSIMHHKDTLKSLVYHHRIYDHEWLDSAWSVDKDEIVALFSQLSLESLGICLRSIRTDTALGSLTDQIYARITSQQLSNLKFLHCRTTLHNGFEDYSDDSFDHHQFAKWAFTTFRKLKIIAFGDFSYGRQNLSEIDQKIYYRFSKEAVDIEAALQQMKVGTDENYHQEAVHFRRLQVEERNLDVELTLESYKNILEACPADPMYIKDF